MIADYDKALIDCRWAHATHVPTTELFVELFVGNHIAYFEGRDKDASIYICSISMWNTF